MRRKIKRYTDWTYDLLCAVAMLGAVASWWLAIYVLAGGR